MWTTTLGTLLVLVRVGAHPTLAPNRNGQGQGGSGQTFFPKAYYYNRNGQHAVHPGPGSSRDTPGGRGTNSVYYGYVFPGGGHYHYRYPHVVPNTRHYHDTPSGGATGRYVEYYGPEHRDATDAHQGEQRGRIQYGAGGVGGDVSDFEREVKNEPETVEETNDDQDDVFWGTHFGIDEDSFVEATNRKQDGRINPEVTHIERGEDLDNVEVMNGRYTKKHDSIWPTDNLVQQTTIKSAHNPAMPACFFVGQVICNDTDACRYRECVPGTAGLYGVQRTCPRGLATGEAVCRRLDELSKASRQLKDRLYVNPCTRLAMDCSITPAPPAPTQAPVSARRPVMSRPYPTRVDPDPGHTQPSHESRRDPPRPLRAGRATWAPHTPEEAPYSYSTQPPTIPKTRPSPPSTTTRTTLPPTPIPADLASGHIQSFYTVSSGPEHPSFSVSVSVGQPQHLPHFDGESTTKSTLEPSTFFNPTGADQPVPPSPWYRGNHGNTNRQQSPEALTSKAPTPGRSTTSRTVRGLEESTSRPVPWYYNNFVGLRDAYTAQQGRTEDDVNRTNSRHVDDYPQGGHFADHPGGHTEELDTSTPSGVERVSDGERPLHQVAPGGDEPPEFQERFVIQAYDPLSTTQASPSLNVQNQHQREPQDTPAPTEEPFESANIDEQYTFSDDPFYPSYNDDYYPDYYYGF